jgi:hypothetical protein
LLAWTQKSWSHLPSAFSYINKNTPWWCEWARCNNLTWDARWEYQMACQEIWFTDWSWDYIWLSALWDVSGYRRWSYIRTVSDWGGCWQWYEPTGDHGGNNSARFVIRP